MIPLKTILHPTDFSKPSEYALRFACALARDYQARLLLLHVVEPPVYYGELGMAVPLPADFHESLHTSACRGSYPSNVEFSSRRSSSRGTPRSRFSASRKSMHCDLIILGTHGRTGLSRVLLGSVAEDVIRHSRFPVLTLKTPTLLDATSLESREARAVVARQAAEEASRGVCW